jgi:choline dehydrogenase-like flavoprotein
LASFGAATADIGNRIVLDNPGDPASAGLGDFHVIYDRSPRDLETLGAMEQSLEQIASAIGTSLIRTQVNPPGRALHEIGGLRMSADPETGVTDPFGRFWRIGNLSVADASTFPSQGSANPYLTITAWSLRHAVALAEELGSRS